ncbi:MAG: hypothetical protein EZS28_014203 [Streblomastix strix]|uniref:Uncharacterized protein n=1 Tax=Streblomastix strix TaxID=222440 RepID=A0A5J4W6G1_9EUKA|nr:MAG: hypothetical protein EZS28_014203 [Streblomastix strix]
MKLTPLNNNFGGAPCYVSLRTDHVFDYGRSDDLISLLNVMIKFRTGKLRWTSLKTKQGHLAYDEQRKTFLVLFFIPRLEIEAFLADQGLISPTFDKDEPRFIEKLDALKLYKLSKKMTFEDLSQRFPAMNNTFSKTETQQKMTYAQVANSQEEQLRFFMENSPKQQCIANGNFIWPAALLPLPSAPPSSATSSIDDSDSGFTHSRRRSVNEQKGTSLRLRAAQVAHCQVNTTERTKRRASAGGIVFQSRIRVDQVALDHLVGISIIGDITTINVTTEMANFGKKWPKQWEFIGLPSLIRTKWNLDIQGRRSAEQNRWRYENQRSTSEPAEIQPSGFSHVYADCAGAVSLAESALICRTEIKHRATIDQPAQISMAHDNGQYYGRRNNYREKRHKQLNDNQ